MAEQAWINVIRRHNPELGEQLDKRLHDLEETLDQPGDRVVLGEPPDRFGPKELQARAAELDAMIKRAAEEAELAKLYGSEEQKTAATEALNLLKAFKVAHLAKPGTAPWTPSEVASEQERLKSQAAQRQDEQQTSRDAPGQNRAALVPQDLDPAQRLLHDVEEGLGSAEFEPDHAWLLRAGGGLHLGAQEQAVKESLTFGADTFELAESDREAVSGGHLFLNPEVPLFAFSEAVVPEGTSLALVAGAFGRIFPGGEETLTADFHGGPEDDTVMTFNPALSLDPYLGLRIANDALPFTITPYFGPSLLFAEHKIVSDETSGGGVVETFGGSEGHLGAHGGFMFDVPLTPGTNVMVGFGASWHRIEVEGKSSTFPDIIRYDATTDRVQVGVSIGISLPLGRAPINPAPPAFPEVVYVPPAPPAVVTGPVDPGPPIQVAVADPPTGSYLCGANATVRFSQVSFQLDGTSYPDSAWGRAHVSYQGTGSAVSYFYLSSNGEWLFRGLPLRGAEPRQTVDLDLWFPLDVPDGTDVDTMTFNCDNGDQQPVGAPPDDDQEAAVEEESVVVWSSFRDGRVSYRRPARWTAMQELLDSEVVASAFHPLDDIVNQECGPKACFLAAISNSLKMQRKWFPEQLGHLTDDPDDDSDDTDVGMFMELDGMFDPPTADEGPDETDRPEGIMHAMPDLSGGSPGGTVDDPKASWNLKKKFMDEDPRYPIETTLINDPAQIGTILTHIENRADCEFISSGHAVMVTGAVELENGAYVFEIADDGRQGEEGGTGLSIVLFDPSSKTFYGNGVALDGEPMKVGGSKPMFLCETVQQQ